MLSPVQHLGHLSKRSEYPAPRFSEPAFLVKIRNIGNTHLLQHFMAAVQEMISVEIFVLDLTISNILVLDKLGIGMHF